MVLVGGIHSRASCLVLEDLSAYSLLFLDLTIIVGHIYMVYIVKYNEIHI